MGCVHFYVLKRDYKKALEWTNQAIVRYEWFVPALCKKAQILMMMSNWDQALEIMNRSYDKDPKNITVLHLLCLFYLSRGGDVATVEEYLNTLKRQLQKQEPNNPTLYLRTCRPIARLAGRNKQILEHCIQMMEHSHDASPDSSGVATELAELKLYNGDLSESMKLYKRASKLDESNVAAIQGMIHCQILSGKLKDAKDQLDFFSVIQDSVEETPELLYLKAQLAWKNDGDESGHIKILAQIVEMHQQDLKYAQYKGNCPKYSPEWFEKFNPDFLLEVSDQYLQHCGDQPVGAGEAMTPALEGVTSLLQLISQHVPGSLSAKVKLAKCYLIKGDFDAASSSIVGVLKMDPAFSVAHLLAARISILRDDFVAASKALEEALSHDFSIRKTPVYHLIKSRVLQSKGDLEGAKEILQECVALPSVGGMDRESSKRLEIDENNSVSEISLTDRATVFIQLAEVHSKLGELDQAEAVVSRAQQCFKGTSEEVRIIVLKSRLLVKRDDIDGGLELLENIKPDSPAWLKAVETRADIYLHHKRSKQQYTACYMMIVERRPCKQSYVLLGDSYIRIQEPEAAIGAYENALKLDPKDANLATMIGKALFSTHDYKNAINYYRSALDGSSNNSTRRAALRISLGELYAKLKRWTDATALLEGMLKEKNQNEEDSKSDDGDYILMVQKVSIIRLLAKVYFGSNDNEQGIAALEEAKVAQNNVLKNIGTRSDAGQTREQRQIAANIRFQMGEFYNNLGKEKKALEYFSDALKYDDTHEKSLLSIAQAKLNRGDSTECESHCKTLLRIDPGNIDASMMLADAMFHKSEFSAALYNFQQLLNDRPANFDILSRMVVLLWRAGKLEEAKVYIDRARKAAPRLVHTAGFNYCQGLYERFSSNPSEAIRFLNFARRDGKWGKKALQQMIRIYLNPAGNHMWEEKESRPDAIGAVQVIGTLLREARMQPHTNMDTVLQCYANLLTRNPKKIKSVLHACVKLIEKDRGFVPALLCMAIALAVNDQMPKARNQLKRICKLPYKQEWAEEFEETYLMLATIYIESKKFDLALELCKRCLKHNKSCSAAWEHMGLIMERECAYKDAAEYYEAAWKYESNASAPIGYKLAFNYLKAKRYIEAVNVCHKVIKLFPDYPRIRDDILMKARMAMRSGN